MGIHSLSSLNWKSGLFGNALRSLGRWLPFVARNITFYLCVNFFFEFVRTLHWSCFVIWLDVLVGVLVNLSFTLNWVYIFHHPNPILIYSFLIKGKYVWHILLQNVISKNSLPRSLGLNVMLVGWWHIQMFGMFCI